MNTKSFTAAQVTDLTGRTAVITGANTGLGFETAKVLAAKGACVIIACRSLDKANHAIASIKTEYPGASIRSIELKLDSMQSIRSAAESLSDLPKLDLLINNAGIMTPPLSLTEDGFESQFGVNHLGPFALTGLLISKLFGTPGARIVNTSSLAGRRGEISFDDIHASRSYDAMKRYSMSKHANFLFSQELNRRLHKSGAECISVACHPGIADTELSRYFPKWFGFIAPVVRHAFNTPAQGAWPTLQAATDPTVSGGEYFGPSRLMQTSGPSKRVSPYDYSVTEAKKLWEISEELTGVSYL